MKPVESEKKMTRSQFIQSSFQCFTLGAVSCPILLGVLSSCGATQDSDSQALGATGTGGQVVLDLTLDKYGALLNVGGVVELQATDEENVPAGGVIVLRKSEEQVAAFNRICPHAAGLVSIDSSSSLARCARHGALFNNSGLATSGPASGLKLRVYEASLDSSKVIITVS